ncbi:hypothetical protein AVEN_52198-1 [Araneus ventricosus]|uniref:Uncharacterized protein n=1 Tax=Araneus ventricosus TaxID=182803 RepID=A0A4Y2QGQ6_ARAVE|nr:hypothetical protein AVEN_52198-1 [Araneus ventricosus]
MRHRYTPLENVKDHLRLILLVLHQDGLVDVGTRGVVCDNILSHPPAVGWSCKDFSNQENDRQSVLTVRARQVAAFPLTGTDKTWHA